MQKMTVSQDAIRLLEHLTNPIEVGVALLEVFHFCDSHRAACWGWLPLGDAQVEGYALDKVVGRARSTLRDAFLENRAIADVADVIGARSSLNAIAGSGTISAENSAEIVRGMRALDDALRGFHPARVAGSSDSMAAARLRGQLRNGRPLAKNNRYALYPRPLSAKPPERGQGDAGLLLNHVAVMRLVADFDVRLVVHLQDQLIDQAQFNRVGVVPVIHDHKELAWQSVGESRYRVDEVAASGAAIKNRVEHALSEMATQAAQLILMPELVSGPALRAVVATHLGERSRRGELVPVITLCGTSLENVQGTTRNQAAILDWEGDVLWTQNKLHAYRFSAADQGRLGFPLGENPKDRQEAIDVAPSALIVVDLSANIRIVVLICEDLIQVQPHAAAIQQMGVTTVLSPIMDKTPDLIPNTLAPDLAWLKDGALSYIRHPGASTFIANSGTLVLDNRDQHWSYAHAFTVPRCKNEWRPVAAVEPALPPVGWILDLS